MFNQRIIAVIDDDKGMRISLDGLLRSLHYRTALFASAEAFLDEGGGWPFDCVISDIAMPGGISGLELARRLAAERARMPLILMSSCADRSCRDKAEELGVNAFLAKPFDDEILVGFLDRALAR